MPARTLKTLALARGLNLHDLGPASTMALFNQGRRLPGAKALNRMATALQMPTDEVLAVCQELVAAAQEAANG